MRWLVLAAVASLAAGAARAEERDLCPDRPGKGSPPCVLDAGRWQVELGVADYARDAGAESWSLGALEVRAGLTPTLEAEAAWTAWTSVRGVGRASGAGDLTLSLRQSLAHPGGDGVSIAVEPFVSAPTGAAGIGDGRWEGGVVLPVAIALPDGFGLGVSPQLRSEADGVGFGRHAVWSAALGLSHDLGPVSAGVELWAQDDLDPAGHVTQATLDLTAAYVPPRHDDVQFDAGVYLGLDRAAPDVEVAIGVARRF